MVRTRFVLLHFMIPPLDGEPSLSASNDKQNVRFSDRSIADKAGSEVHLYSKPASKLSLLSGKRSEPKQETTRVSPSTCSSRELARRLP